MFLLYTFQMSDIYLAITLGATVHFSKPDALKVMAFIDTHCKFFIINNLQGALVTYLQESQPTIFFGVPRVYEKIMEKMQERMAELKGIKKRIRKWSMRKGLKGNRRRQNRLDFSNLLSTVCFTLF